MNDKDTPPAVVRDESDSEQTSRKRRTILKLLIGACLVVAPLLYAIEIMSSGPNDMETTKERDEMFLSKTKPEPNLAIPPIDANLPARIETATFALG